jgi:hypothetical protein
MTLRRLNQPDDRLIAAPENERGTLLDFWNWAYSDLCDDDIKGVFAEWLVYRLLGVQSGRRISWANSDVVTDGNVTLEVKSSSFWQSWKLLNGRAKPYETPLHELPKDDSRIRFAGLLAYSRETRPTRQTERKCRD